MASDERIGVIGLGIIGGAWAKNYELDGVLAGTWNRTARPGAPLLLADPAAVARQCSVLHIVVAGPPAVDQVIEALAPALDSRHLVIQSSTIDGPSAAGFAERVAERGAAYVEAPFMGSLPAARDRKSIFMLGGDPEAVARAEPVLARLSEVRHRAGQVSQAAALKVSFNVLVSAMMQGICESLAAARHAGIPDDVYFSSLRGTALWSGLTALKEPKLRSSEFSPQFSVRHLHKDLRLAADMVGAETLPLASVVRDRLAELEAEGFAEIDMTILIRRL
jgi:3-hydroxyisobutyrate dehydrogenase-like beta-hydroxyacid dehydrogenase